jgi:integrase
MHAFVLLAAATGCRRGELLALIWPDVDWISGALHITKSLEETKKGIRVKGTKSGEPRKFVVPAVALQALKEHHIPQAEHKRLFGADYCNSQLIFCEPNGEFLSPSNITRRITKL